MSEPDSNRFDVSLIVVNHQTPDEVAALLHSLQEHPPSVDYEVIVVNTVAQGAYAKNENDTHVQILQMDANRGFGSSVNCGVAEAGGKFLMPMNADILFEDDCLPRMVRHMREHPTTAVLFPKLLTATRELQFNARRFYSLFTVLCRRTPLGRLFPAISRRHLMQEEDHNAIFPADWGMGAAFMTRREMLIDGKLMDERFFLYFEDVDLCARAWAAKKRVEYFPPAQLMHAHRRESAKAPWSLQGRAHLKSLWAFWRKHGTLRPQGAESEK